MPLGLLGKKLGHTRVYNAQGVLIPVTVVLAGPNRVLQVKTQAGKDGYNSVQLGFDDQKEQRLSKALAGHIKKHNGVAVKRIKEFRNFSKEVKAGDVVVVLEAMKMENVFKAAADVTIKEIKIQERQTVEKGQVLILFE